MLVLFTFLPFSCTAHSPPRTRTLHLFISSLPLVANISNNIYTPFVKISPQPGMVMRVNTKQCCGMDSLGGKRTGTHQHGERRTVRRCL
jgi:hypothetical protein